VTRCGQRQQRRRPDDVRRRVLQSRSTPRTPTSLTPRTAQPVTSAPLQYITPAHREIDLPPVMSSSKRSGYRPRRTATDYNGPQWVRVTIQYDSVYLTCSKKLTGSQLSLPHAINKKLKCETKNKMMSLIGPVQSRYREAVQ